MREFKFRAVRLSDGQVFLPIAIYQTGDEPVVEWISDTGPSQLSDTPGNEVVLMQYTGLKDKNGREIFEGDIIKFAVERDFTDYHGEWTDKEVVYRNGQWIASYVRSERGRLPRGYVADELTNHILHWDKDAVFDDTGHWSTVDGEVIGNIYENPELLQ